MPPPPDRSATTDPPDPLRLRVATSLDELGRVLEQFAAYAARHSIGDAVRRVTCMALDELLHNAVVHGHSGDARHWIDVCVELSSDRLTTTVVDDGPPFDPFGRADPDTTSSLEQRKIGGLGIHLVKDLMDEATYERRAGRNVVTVSKRFSRHSGN